VFGAKVATIGEVSALTFAEVSEWLSIGVDALALRKG
jgi:hypothetical protein